MLYLTEIILLSYSLETQRGKIELDKINVVFDGNHSTFF